MADEEVWIADCHLRKVEDETEYHCQAAVRADSEDRFRVRLTVHLTDQGYDILSLEDCLSAPLYLTLHSAQASVVALARVVHSGYPVELGPMVPFQLRFLFASQPKIMSQVLAIVYRALVTHQIHKAGHSHATARTGMVTLIQRFGSALNLNIHFHMLLPDGVYVNTGRSLMMFQRTNAPNKEELLQLTHTIAQRVGRYLERRGFIERDTQNTYLSASTQNDEPMHSLLGHCITYRVAIGPHAGRKVFTLQTLPEQGERTNRHERVAKLSGFSLHAGVAAQAQQRAKLERLCRYVSRPSVSEKRLSKTRTGHIRYQLKTPYQDGTTHVIFEPLDFIARLASLVPKPRVNLTRYHGVFAPNSHCRSVVTPAQRGTQSKNRQYNLAKPGTSMNWAARLKRVFNIDITQCPQCQRHMKVTASIEDPLVIRQILDHIKAKTKTRDTTAKSRSPPNMLLD